MEKNFEILKADQSSETRKIIKDISTHGLEGIGTIVETCVGVPFIGPLINLGKGAIGINDYLFIKKLNKFSDATNDVSDDEKMQFIQKLKPKDYYRITSYLINLLNSAEEEGKAELMGKIYKARVINHIDNDDIMLRLCSIVNRSFLTDLYHLDLFLEVTDDHQFLASNLYSLGLLQDCGTYSTVEKDGWVAPNFGASRYKLNELGRLLHEIIK